MDKVSKALPFHLPPATGRALTKQLFGIDEPQEVLPLPVTRTEMRPMSEAQQEEMFGADLDAWLIRAEAHQDLPHRLSVKRRRRTTRKE
jgi:hypothetical protein